MADEKPNATHIGLAVVLSGGISGLGVSQFHSTKDELDFCSEYINHNQKHVEMVCEVNMMKLLTKCQ